MTHRSIRFFVSVCLLALLTSACFTPFGNYFAPTAAVVGNVKIPESDINLRLTQVLKQQGFEEFFGDADAEQRRQEAKRTILTQLIRAQVIVQAAKELGIEVTDDQVDAQIQVTISRFGSEELFLEEVENQGLTVEQIREEFRQQLIIAGAQEQLFEGLTAPEEEVRASYEQNAPNYSSQVQVAHILFCSQLQENNVCSPTAEDEQTAIEIGKRAQAGEDFALLAQEFSDDPASASTGGELGWSDPNQTLAEFGAAIEALEPGEVSQPFVTQFGLHLLKVLAKGRPFEDAREEIEANLLEEQRQGVFENWFNEALKNSADRIRINRRFGRFDETTFVVVANDSPANA